MNASNLQPVERKVLGAMLIHADSSMTVQASITEVAHTMGYKSTGGAITYALQALEMKNFISKDGKKYKVLL